MHAGIRTQTLAQEEQFRLVRVDADDFSRLELAEVAEKLLPYGAAHSGDENALTAPSRAIGSR